MELHPLIGYFYLMVSKFSDTLNLAICDEIKFNDPFNLSIDVIN